MGHFSVDKHNRFHKWLRCRNPHTSIHIHYTSDGKLFFAWAGKPPASITLHDVDAYACTERSECVAHCRSLGHAPATVNRDESEAAGAADEWRWAFGTGVSSTLASPVYTYTLPGVYTVTQ